MRELNFLKMSGASNDFIILDARYNDLKLTSLQVKKLAYRKNIGCDQLIIIRNTSNADCLMEINNPDGSKSAACGNATRCVASLIMAEKNLEQITIETAAGILKCSRFDEHNISVEMGLVKFGQNNFYFNDLEFSALDVGNPHAVTFVSEIPDDETFFFTASQVENHPFFPNKTNVEFAKICSDNLIEVRVFERGVGETLACGSGACAVAALAIKKKLISSNIVTIRFKGGDLVIEWKSENSPVIMTGDYKKIFSGRLDENFL